MMIKHHEQALSAALWDGIRQDSLKVVKNEPVLLAAMDTNIFMHEDFAKGLAHILASKLCDNDFSLPYGLLYAQFKSYYARNPEIFSAAAADLEAVVKRDPAVKGRHEPFLYFKGFHALQTYRLANCMIKEGRRDFALILQSLSSSLWGVDIHPSATIGSGVMIDHGTGVVIGETAIIGDNVSILHAVTLGGTGKQCQERHPIIEDDVLLGAGATILGRITIGKGARIAAESVVTRDVAPGLTMVGNPARVVGQAPPKAGQIMDQIPQELSHGAQEKPPVNARKMAGARHG